MPVTAYPPHPSHPPLIDSLFWWTTAEPTSLQLLYNRLSTLPPPAIQSIRTPQKQHILSYRAFRPSNSDPQSHHHSIHHVSLPHHQADPLSQFWIHDDPQQLTVMELGASFAEILARMDTGWQDRQGTALVLEGRGFEWGKDWRIWCANVKHANRYRGVIVEVQYVPSMSLLASKELLKEFAERHIFRTGEQVRPFWGKRIYPPIHAHTPTTPQQQEAKDKDFEEWHTAMQYIELVEFMSSGRRRSSINQLE